MPQQPEFSTVQLETLFNLPTESALPGLDLPINRDDPIVQITYSYDDIVAMLCDYGE